MNNCAGCYWNGKCDGHLPCEDFTPLESDSDIEFYESVLTEHDEEYRSFLQEMNF